MPIGNRRRRIIAYTDSFVRIKLPHSRLYPMGSIASTLCFFICISGPFTALLAPRAQALQQPAQLTPILLSHCQLSKFFHKLRSIDKCYRNAIIFFGKRMIYVAGYNKIIPFRIIATKCCKIFP